MIILLTKENAMLAGSTVLGFFLLTSGAASTSDPRNARELLRPITGKVKDAGVLHLSTGTWTRTGAGQPALATGPDIVYSNTCFTQYYAGMQQNMIFIDEGVIPDPGQASTTSSFIPGGLDTNPGCTADYSVNGFEIGYCTFQTSYTCEVSFYSSYGPASMPCSVPGAATATFTIPGLPGAGLNPQACWLVQIDVSGGGEFLLAGTGTSSNNFGWGFKQVGPSSSSHPDGPLISADFTQCTGTDGTRWDNGTASVAWPNNIGESGTGMLTLDAFRIEGVVNPVPGCYWFGGNPYASFHLALCSDTPTAFCGPVPPGTAYCFGDGTIATQCPCGNSGAIGNGCDNSASTGGANLTAAGTASITNDTVILTQTGELTTALTIFLQGNSNLASGVVFGDGVRCAAGSLLRLYTKNASGGAVIAPQGAEISITARSTQLGQPINPGDTRFYQVYYRDPDLGYCPPPAGNSWNVGNGYQITWQ